MSKKQASFIISLIAVLFVSVSEYRKAPTIPVSSQLSSIIHTEDSVRTTTTLQDTQSVENNFYVVSRVVDGDTIEVVKNQIKEKVRLIGINTPETVDPRKKVECFGKEASAHAKEILLNQKVRLVSDDTQTKYDKYGRLLAYVYREDGLFVNKHMISEGYAYEYTYKVPYQFQKEFKEAQKQAEREGKGLWGVGVCE